MYYDDTSYLILDLGSGKVMEYGYDGAQAYSRAKEEKLYYAGPLNHFLKSGDSYYKLGEEKIYETLPTIDGVELTKTAEEVMKQTNLNTLELESVARTLVTEQYVDDRYWIQDLAFGNNASGTPESGTCTAVATEVVLNYLNKTRTPWYVPNSNYSAEFLITSYFNPTLYPNAKRLHQELISCGMGWASYGLRVSNAILEYRRRHLSTYLVVDYTSLNNDPRYITDQIDVNIPGMITTTFSTEGYDTHTMAVYGYKKYSDNSYDFCVHTGWYDSIVVVGTDYYMPRIFVPSNYETWMYKFFISN